MFGGKLALLGLLYGTLDFIGGSGADVSSIKN
jgi:hypothetical protein